MSDTSDSHLRRSKRIRKQIDYHEHAEHGEEADSVAKGLRFRKDKTLAHDKDLKQKGARRKRGFLQRLKELPLDVVFEIFNHLTPYDLLNLTRTGKDLRKLLLSRSTTLVWKSARMNVAGLPDIPDDMSEPAYAHLCFDVRCHHCDNRHPAVNLFWHSRTRSCHGCLNRGFYHKEEVYWHEYATNREWRPLPQSHLPDFYEVWEIIRYRGDVKKDNRRANYFYCSEAERQQIVAELQANRDKPQWKQKKITEGEAIAKHAQQMQEWWRSEAERHQTELEKKRKERENEILQRLADNGWEEELRKQRATNNLGFLYELGIGTRAKTLTESDWNELEPKLEQALTQAKERRLVKEHKEKWTRRYHDFKELLTKELNQLPFNTVGPSVFDIANLPEFQQILFTSIDHQITRDDLAGLIDRLPEIREQWIRSREEELVRLVKTNKPGECKISTDILHHASTIFVCVDCTSLCPYPKPLVHRCSRVGPSYYGYHGYLLGVTPSFSQFLTATHGRVWDIKHYRYQECASNTAQAILLECGLSPSAKLDEVIRTNIWLEWEDTRFPQAAVITGGRALYTLCRAMYTPSRLGRRWIIASDENVARANDEAKVSGTTIQTAMCNHCQVAIGSYGIVKHLETQHGVTTLSPEDLIPSLEEEPWSLDFDVVRLQVADSTPTAEAQAQAPEVNPGSSSGIAPIA